MSSNTKDTLFINGQIFSADESGKNAVFRDAMLVQDGIIQHVGQRSDAAIADIETSDSGVQVQDLGGKIVLPGFIDGHMHLLLLGQSLQKLDLDGSKDLDEIRTRIKAYAQQHPDAKRVLCRGWMHSMTNGEAKASMLDDLDPRPIFIDSKDLHSTWCNSAALDELGAHGMSDPVGGSIERDPVTGKASGLLSEACTLLITWPHIARVASMEEKIAALRAAVQAYNATGYTGMIDMAMDENGWEAVQALKKAEGGKLSVRLAAHWLITPGSSEEERLAQVDRAIALNKEFNEHTSPDLRVVGIKVICDGVIDACTAALCEPYSTTGVSPDPLWTSSMLAPVIRKADAANLQIALHAIGDAAVNLAINSLEAHSTSGRRHRIEHLELTSPADAQRLGQLGITASIQPVHADPAILRAWTALLGPERRKRAFAYKEFLDGGAVLSIGSDSPTAPYAPLPNLYVATTRKSARDTVSKDEPVNENFKLGLCEAITAGSAGSAFSCFAEKRLGRLEKGLLADFVVVDVDVKFEAEALLEARVSQTWFGGEMVYEREV